MITNINVGLTANDGLGDKLRDAFIIVNENFDAIDTLLSGSDALTISQITGLQTALDNIQTQLDYIPGLQSDINSINNTIYTINQTLNSQNTSIADLYDEITNLQNQIYTKIEEAPIDGVTYGRKDGAWVVVSGGVVTIDLDGVLANGNIAIDKTMEITNTGSSVKTSITPSKTTIGDISSERIELNGDKITFKSATTEAILKYNTGQANGFIPTFQLPSKPITGLYTLATTVDYTLQAVTSLNNTTTNGIQFQPVLNTGTGSKYVNVGNTQVYLLSQSEGYSTLTHDKIIWSRFGNVVSLSGFGAAGSNSADYILPTKPFAGSPYTLATTTDITILNVVSGNTNNLNVVSSGTTRILYSRGLTSSNQTISITATGSSASSTYAWDAKVNPNLVLDSLTFNTAPTTTGAVGRFVWNDTDGTLDLGLKGGNVTLQVGQETVIRVVNKTTTNITLQESAYQAVRITGAQGNRLKVDLAIATNDLLSAETIGLVTETILNNQEGFITTSGLIRGINTTGSLQSETWIDGDVLYLSPTTAGNITNIKPIAPNHLVIIGYVVRAHITQGQIFVKVDNGYELDELHNVKIIGATAGQVLTYNGTSSLWENKPLYSPVFNDVTNVISATATTGTIARTGDIALYGSTRYYRTLTSTSSTIGSIWGHVDNGQGASGFVTMFSNGPNFGVVNAFNGSYASASTTEAQLTFCAIKNTTYAKWTDDRLLFRFQNGYYTNDKIIDIGTNYIQFYGYTSSRVDTGFTPVNYLTTDDLGVLKSRPITDLATTTFLNEDYIIDTLLENQLMYFIPQLGVTTFNTLRVAQITQAGQVAYFGQPTANRYDTTIVPGTFAVIRGTNITIGTNNFISKMSFAIISNVTNSRFFCGYSNMFRLAGPSNVEPDTLINSMGVCKLSTSDNLHFMHNDGGGLATTIDLGVEFPANNIITYRYTLEFIRKVGDTNITMTITRNDGLSSSVEISTNIPTGGQSKAIYMTNNTTASITSYLFYGAVYKTL